MAHDPLLRDIDEPVHGGKDIEELKRHGLDPEECIDFSASLNPLGPPEFLMKRIRGVPKSKIGNYPDTSCREGRETLSDQLGIDSEKFIITAGITGLLNILSKVFLDKNKTVCIPAHTYGEYEHFAKISRSEIKTIEMPELKLKKDDIISAVEENSVVFLCNPNNPTGGLLRKEEIEEIMNEIRRKNAFLVIDEAYIDFVEDPPVLHRLELSNLVLMRSFTKSFGIPGIRLGYGISSKENIHLMRKVKLSWEVSGIAQFLLPELITNKARKFVAKSKKMIHIRKREMEKDLERSNLSLLPSTANFILIEVGNASEIRKESLKKGVIVRDCSSFGLPYHIRISIRGKEENSKLLEVFRSILTT